MVATPCCTYGEVFRFSSVPISDFGPEQLTHTFIDKVKLYMHSPTLLTNFLVVLSTSALVIQDLFPLFSRAATDDLTSEPDLSFSEL